MTLILTNPNTYPRNLTNPKPNPDPKFDIEYDLLEKVAVEGYASKIPAVLEMLVRHFVAQDGKSVEGNTHIYILCFSLFLI